MSNVYKANFIQFSPENTKVIDMSSLVAKRLEGFSGVLREAEPELLIDEPEASGVNPLAMAELLADRDAALEDYEEGAASEEGYYVGDFDESEGYQGEIPDSEEYESPEQMRERVLEEIEQYKAVAREEIDALRSAAHDEGFDKGYNEGLSKGYNEYNAKIAELKVREAELLTEYEKALSEVEPRIVETITAIYKKVFNDGLYCPETVITELVNRAIRNANRSDNIVIHVSPAEYDMLLEAKDSLFGNAGFEREPELRPDDRFEPGMVKIETSFGIMDCSIDTELNELSRMLHLLAYEV